MLKFRLERKEWKAYHELWDRVLAERADVYPAVKAARLGAKANAYFQADDETAFETVAREIDKLPLDKDTLRAVADASGLMSRRADFGSEPRERLWKRLIDNRATFAPPDRLQILEAMFGFADRTGQRRLPKGEIDAARAVWNEAAKLEAEGGAGRQALCGMLGADRERIVVELGAVQRATSRQHGRRGMGFAGLRTQDDA